MWLYSLNVHSSPFSSSATKSTKIPELVLYSKYSQEYLRRKHQQRQKCSSRESPGGIFGKGTPYRFVFEKGKVTNKPHICQAWWREA